MIDKTKLQSIIKTYFGTPAVNGAKIKGAGVDCSTFPALVFEELGYGPFEIDPGYSNDWYMAKSGGDILIPYLDRYCYRIKEEEITDGDIIAYQYGHAVCHLSIVYDITNRIVAHVHAVRGVEITYMDDSVFFKGKKSRIHSFWRLKEEV